eukprot:g3055.t1
MKRRILPQERPAEKSLLHCPNIGSLWGTYGRLWSSCHARWNAVVSANGFIGRVSLSSSANALTEADTMAIVPHPRPMLALADKRGALFLLDLEGNRYARLIQPSTRIEALHVSKCERNCILIGRVDGSIEYYNTKTKTTFKRHIGLHTQKILDIDSILDANTHFSCSGDIVVLWNAASCEPRARVQSNDHSFLRGQLLRNESNSFVILDSGWNLNIGCIRSGRILKTLQFHCISEVYQPCLLTIHRKQEASGVVVLQDPYTLLYVETKTGVIQSLALPEDKHHDMVVDLDLTINNIFVVCRQKTCLFVDLKDWKILSRLSYENWEPGAFIGKSIACEGNLLTVLSDTGIGLLYNVKDLLSSQNSDLGNLQTKYTEKTKIKTKRREVLQPTVKPLVTSSYGRQLNKLVLLHGQFPNKYRRLVWTKLLQLPNNNLAFHELQSRKLPESAFNLFPCFSEQVHSKKSRIDRQQQRSLLNLVKLNQVFAKVAFIEDFIRPFVIQFSYNDQITFEAIVTVLGNWYQDLIMSYPKPPWNLLCRLSALLKYHEKKLHGQLEEAQCLYFVLWELLSTGFSRVLSYSNWCMVWDHILSSDASFLYYFALAIVKSLHGVIASAISGGKEAIKRFLSIPANLDMDLVLNHAYKIMESTPECLQIKSRVFQQLKAESGSYIDFFSSIQLSSGQSVQKIIETEESILQQKRIHEQLQQQTLALESLLEFQNRCIENGDILLSQTDVAGGRDDVIEAVLKGKMKDLRNIQDHSREQKLQHLKIVNSILKQREKAKQERAVAQQKLKTEQNRRQLKVTNLLEFCDLKGAIVGS